MKVEYKNIIGQLVEKDMPCRECCFSFLIYCVPSTLHKCHRHIFEEGKAQVFNL